MMHICRVEWWYIQTFTALKHHFETLIYILQYPYATLYIIYIDYNITTDSDNAHKQTEVYSLVRKSACLT
jgi:hypothetical protein